MLVTSATKALDEIFFIYAHVEQKIRNDFKPNEKDIRFSYYRASLNIVESTAHLLAFSEGCLNEAILKETYKKYPLRNRLELYSHIQKSPIEILSSGIYQFIANGFFSGIYHIFENSFRLLCESYDPDYYKKLMEQRRGIKIIFKEFLTKFKNENNDLDHIEIGNFEYIRNIRNSIHSNGVYKQDSKNHIEIIDFWKNKAKLEHNKLIKFDDFWVVNFGMALWCLDVITGIVYVPKFQKVDFILDPSI